MIAKKPPKKWKEIGGIEESPDKKKKKKDYSFQLPVRRMLIHFDLLEYLDDNNDDSENENDYANSF